MLCMTYIIGALLGALICLCLLLLVLSGRAGDALYLALRHYKASLFVLLCIAVGTLSGLNIRNLNPAVTVNVLPEIALPSLNTLYQPSAERTLITIRNCQAFITAQLEQAPQAAPAPLASHQYNSSLLHLASEALPWHPAPAQPWERCARAFGTHYGTIDTSIKGEKGGKALCRAYYAQTAYRTEKVEIWCETAFKDSAGTPAP